MVMARDAYVEKESVRGSGVRGGGVVRGSGVRGGRGGRGGGVVSE